MNAGNQKEPIEIPKSPNTTLNVCCGKGSFRRRERKIMGVLFEYKTSVYRIIYEFGFWMLRRKWRNLIFSVNLECNVGLIIRV